MIDKKKMLLLWDYDPDTRKISKLKIVDIDKQTPQDMGLSASAGASDAGWLTSDLPIQTPIGLWAYLMTCHGFESVEAKRAALYQFRNVEDQKNWTTMLLRELGDPKIDSIVESE